MITPRATRLVRTADLGGFREALVSLACDGEPLTARDRLVVVPTRAAAEHLVRAVEGRHLRDAEAVLLPDFVTPSELPDRFARRLKAFETAGSDARREALLGLACRDAIAAGAEPPFRVRPGLVAEILRFYDALLRNRKDVDTFERLALGMLEPGAEHDRGAARLVRQTRFLAQAFRHFERRCDESGQTDEHVLRRRVMAEAAAAPWRHVVVAVGDRSRDPYGLWPADWDLLARAPGIARLDVVVTDRALAGAFHEQVHDLLPGIEEHRWEHATPAPHLRVPPVPPDGRASSVWVARDREEEVAAFARWVRAASRAGEVDALDGMALVVRQPLPYVYVARDVLRSGGIPCQTFDALPLAAEPYAATLDLIFSFVSANFARLPAIAVLKSPHLRFAGGSRLDRSVVALDRALSEAGYLGDLESLERLVTGWVDEAPARGVLADALPAARVLWSAAQALLPLRTRAAVGTHLECLLAFLTTHENRPVAEDPVRARHLRARGAILGILSSLRDAYRELDPEPVEFDAVAALVRRWIEGHTFAPRSGDAGVHVVDVESARFADFSHVQLAGLVDGEWPERPSRSIFYSAAVLRELGWSPDSERLEGARAAFADLLRLPSSCVSVSAFALEDDAVAALSTLLDELPRSGLESRVDRVERCRMFDDEALAVNPARLDRLDPGTRARAERRLARHAHGLPRRAGQTAGHSAPAYSLSALERYQDCPFKFFASDVLRLEEPPDDESSMSPRARGRFIHELFERFFTEWDARAVRGDGGAIEPGRIDAARALFVEIASEMLARLPEADAALERARLFGSAIATGVVDTVLGLEASRSSTVVERWLEHRFDGDFSLGVAGGRRVPIKGVVDRVDVLANHALRVVDYKSGSAPEVKRALQVPIYALCAQEILSNRDGLPWDVDEGAYIALSGKRTYAPAVRGSAAERESALAAARDRLFAVVDGAARGEFPPRPHDPMMCGYCAFPSVCRKDYVGDD